jgi:hypothetical protein
VPQPLQEDEWAGTGPSRWSLRDRSAIEWIMDRYRVRVDKASQIMDDPNEWSDDPRYIVGLAQTGRDREPVDYGDRRQPGSSGGRRLTAAP